MNFLLHNCKRKGLIITALFCFSLMSCGQQNDFTFTGKLGVQAYSFRNYFPVDMIGTLDTIQSMGIRYIEGSGGRIPPEEFKKLCDARGISIPSTGASFEQLENSPEEVIETAKKLGASYVMCAWVPHEDGVFTKTDADRAIRVFNAAGKVLKQAGITFCYHPHGYEFQPYNGGTLLDYILENTDPQYVSYEMDIFWIHFGGGDPVALLKKYAPRWKLMHLKDMEKGTPKDLTGLTDDNTNVPLGKGELDMEAILQTAAEVGVEYYFIEDESDAVLSQIPQSLKYLAKKKNK